MAAWFRTGRRRWPSSNSDCRHTGHDEGGGRTNDQIGPAGDDPSSGPDEPQRGPKPLTQEDIPTWKFVTGAWGGLGLFAAVVAYLLGIWLAGKHDDHLLRLTTLLVGPCAVLISVSIVSITFAGDWKMTSKQAKRRDILVFRSYFLVGFAVLAIAFAGIYAAVTPVSDGPALLNANMVKGLGAAAASFLTLSLFGVISHAFWIIELVRNQRPNPEDVSLTGENLNSYNNTKA